MKKRVLFVIDGLEYGGGERCFAQVINGLPTDRYEIYLASTENERLYDSISDPGVHLIPLNFCRKFNPSLFVRLERLIRSEGIEIVHGQGARAEFYARLASGIAGTTRYVSTIAMPVDGYEVGKLQKKIYGILDGYTEKYVDRFIVVSDVLKETMINRHTVPAEKVVRIYNGIETDVYNPDVQTEQRCKIRSELAWDDNVILVGAIGRLVWQKGFEYFLQSIPDVVRLLPQTRFVLVGDGILRKPLEDFAKKVGIEKNIFFMGQRDDIRDILSALDIMVVPSLLEGFPMITLEAMAMRKPIVATRIEGITEQITDGKEGLLVQSRSPGELARAIARVVRDPLLAASLGSAARQRVITEFSVQQMIQATLTVYNALS